MSFILAKCFYSNELSLLASAVSELLTMASEIRFPATIETSTSSSVVRKGSGVHPVGYRGLYPRGKLARFRSWPVTSSSTQIKNILSTDLHDNTSLYIVVLTEIILPLSSIRDRI